MHKFEPNLCSELQLKIFEGLKPSLHLVSEQKTLIQKLSYLRISRKVIL
jgi:hypothetical protein